MQGSGPGARGDRVPDPGQLCHPGLEPGQEITRRPGLSCGDGPSRESRWQVNVAARTVTGVTVTREDREETAWDIVGSARAWQAVLTGDTNLGVAMRRCELRYCQTNDAGPGAADTRIGMLADLLGLTRIGYPPLLLTPAGYPGDHPGAAKGAAVQGHDDEDQGM